jgi:hypothetical protein
MPLTPPPLAPIAAFTTADPHAQPIFNGNCQRMTSLEITLFALFHGESANHCMNEPEFWKCAEEKNAPE